MLLSILAYLLCILSSIFCHLWLCIWSPKASTLEQEVNFKLKVKAFGDPRVRCKDCLRLCVPLLRYGFLGQRQRICEANFTPSYLKLRSREILFTEGDAFWESNISLIFDFFRRRRRTKGNLPYSLASYLILSFAIKYLRSK